jgi:hypothetical protein
MTTVLPVITPGTAIGETALRAYGSKPGPLPLTPEIAAGRILELATETTLSSAYVLNREGLAALPQ